MIRVKELFTKFQSSDGRVRAKTATGVLGLVAVVALAVGVLPAIASAPGPSGGGVDPVEVAYGGGSGACSANIAGRLPSAAGFELHINNPIDGQFSAVGPGGTSYKFNIDVHPVGPGSADMYFNFSLDASTPGVVVYDVVVNGGAKNSHYDYDGNGGPGTVKSDTHLHAPKKGSNKVFNLSHINICFDVPGLTSFTCNLAITLTDPEGLFTIAEATIFANSQHECINKRASYFVDNDTEPPTVTLTFAGDGTDTAAGRIDLTKDFTNDATPLVATDFVDLEYDYGTGFDDVPWCSIRTKVAGDGNEFDDVLKTTEYPSLPGSDIACKVFVGEGAAGIQYNVVYFEFVDPQFR
jgi:hypothetical protein